VEDNSEEWVCLRESYRKTEKTVCCLWWIWVANI